jgi:hypothetical protein
VRRLGRALLALACGACGSGRSPPGYAEASHPVEAFLWYELEGRAAEARAFMGRCHIDQSSDTIFAVVRGQNFWRVASHDTTLVMVEYDAVGNVFRVPGADSGAPSSLTFQPGVRRIGETFAVTWDSAGKAALVCGLHRANHLRVGKFRREQFTTADGSRARWDSVVACIDQPGCSGRGF